jgi:hypothetical protein
LSRLTRGEWLSAPRGFHIAHAWEYGLPMTQGIPEWGPVTAFYDSAGQQPSIVCTVAADGLSVIFLLDRLNITLNSGADQPFGGAVGLAGTLSVNVPEALKLVGFVLVVNGHIDKTDGAQATLTCSFGHGTHALQWPLSSIAGVAAADPATAVGRDQQQLFTTSGDFRAECFTSDFNPSILGEPPFLPLPPLPFTVSLQARRRAPDEAIDLAVTDLQVIILTS